MSDWTGSTNPETTETTTSYIPDSTTQYSWIFGFGASGAEVKSKKSGNKAFIFDPEDSTDIIAFSDQSDRFIGTMSLKNWLVNSKNTVIMIICQKEFYELSRRRRMAQSRDINHKFQKKEWKNHVEAESLTHWPDYQDTLYSAHFFIDSWEAEATETSYYVPGVMLSSDITSTNHVASHFLMDFG